MTDAAVAPEGASLACVIPCYNAGPRVAPVVEAALRQAAKVWVVDDGCTDHGLDALAGGPAIILRHATNEGKGHAIRTGLRAALDDPAVEAIVLLDADGQHDPATIPSFVSRFRETGAGMVIGVRAFGGGHVPLRSRFGNAVTASMTRMLLRTALPDTQCGFRLLSRAFAEEVLRQVAGGRYETEMDMLVLAVRSTHGIATVPIQTVYEPGNASSHFRKFSDSARICARLLKAVSR